MNTEARRTLPELQKGEEACADDPELEDSDRS